MMTVSCWKTANLEVFIKRSELFSLHTFTGVQREVVSTGSFFLLCSLECRCTELYRVTVCSIKIISPAELNGYFSEGAPLPGLNDIII